jgi:zinc protease
MFHLPQGANPDSTAFEALAEIMTVEPAGRLYKALVEGKKAASTEQWLFQQHDAGFVIFWAQVPVGDSIDGARDTLLATLYDVAAHPITDAELDRVRTKAQKDFDDTVNDPEKMAVALADAVAEGDWRLFFIRRDRWRQLKPADVTRVAGQWLKPSNLTLGMFMPEAKPDRAPMAAAVDVPALVRNYKGDPPVAAGETFDPTPANLEARTERLQLPNGMKIALLPKKTRGETARIELRLDLGDVESLRNTDPVSGFTAAMLERGTAKHDRQAFADALDKLRAKLDIGGGGATVVVSATTVRASVPDVLRLAAEALREPAFVPSEFEQMKRERLSALEQSRTDPTAIARRAAARAGNPYPPDDVRYTPTIDEEIARVRAADIAAVKAFYAKFYGATHAELAVVGDFDAKETAGQLATLFGGWKSAAPFTRVPSVYTSVVPKTEALETPDKANAVFLAGLNFPLREDDPDYAALSLGNYMLGGGFLNSRLATRIRQKEGLSYGVGSSISASPFDKYATFTTFAIYAPQNAEKLEAAFKDEIAKMLKDGFTAEEVAAAKSGFLQSRQVSRAQDAELSRRLSSYLYYDRTLAFDAAFEKQIEALTPQQVVEAMRKYIDPSKITIVKAGDFAGAAKATQGPKS